MKTKLLASYCTAMKGKSAQLSWLGVIFCAVLTGKLIA